MLTEMILYELIRANTHMVGGLLAKQVQSSHCVHCGANVWQCLQDITFFGLTLTGGRRTS